MPGVFTSYRRDDSAGWAGRIYDRVVAQVGADEVFLDVEVVAPGDDFNMEGSEERAALHAWIDE